MAHTPPLAHAPQFTLRNQKEEDTALADLLARGPVLLAFHRSTR